jgi:integrase
LPAFGHRTLDTIERRDVQLWIRDLTDSGLSPSTVRLINDKLRSILLEAVRDGLLAESPARHIKLPRLATRTVTVPTTDQVLALKLNLPERFRVVVDVISTTGLRVGEMLGLSNDRVDVGQRAVVVDRQRDATGTELFAPPKTAASVRTIPVPSLTLDRVAEHVDRHGVGPCDLLVTTRRQEPMQRWQLADYWKPAARAVGLPPGSGPHCLRHFYASLLIRAGCSVKVVQARLGHATASETLDTYAHLWDDDEDRTRAAVAAIWKHSETTQRETAHARRRDRSGEESAEETTDQDETVGRAAS